MLQPSPSHCSTKQLSQNSFSNNTMLQCSRKTKKIRKSTRFKVESSFKKRLVINVQFAQEEESDNNSNFPSSPCLGDCSFLVCSTKAQELSSCTFGHSYLTPWTPKTEDPLTLPTIVSRPQSVNWFRSSDFVKKKLGSMEWFGLRENLQEPPLNPLMGICLRLSEIVCSIYGCDMLWWQGTARPELLWTSSFWEWWTIAAETNLQLLFCTDHLRQ